MGPPAEHQTDTHKMFFGDFPQTREMCFPAIWVTWADKKNRLTSENVYFQAWTVWAKVDFYPILTRLPVSPRPRLGCNQSLLISNQISKDLDCYKGWRSPSFQAAASLVAPQSSALAGYPAMRIVISGHLFLPTEKDEDGDDGDMCDDGVGSPDCWWCSAWPRCPSLPSTEGPAGL